MLTLAPAGMLTVEAPSGTDGYAAAVTNGGGGPICGTHVSA